MQPAQPLQQNLACGRLLQQLLHVQTSLCGGLIDGRSQGGNRFGTCRALQHGGGVHRLGQHLPVPCRSEHGSQPTQPIQPFAQRPLCLQIE